MNRTIKQFAIENEICPAAALEAGIDAAIARESKC
jgi:hypothetical protein